MEYTAILKAQLSLLGIQKGDVLLVHTSLKGLRAPGFTPGEAISVLQELLTEEGTLLIPSLSYATVTALNPVFHIKKTPSCIGALPECFRMEYAQYRSLHPTHSVCAWGKLARSITAWHRLDHTPVGSHSPFMQLPRLNGKILMLGCGLRPNTFMHGVEEAAKAPYPLAKEPLEYTLTDEDGRVIRQSYYPHHFGPLIQRYDRLEQILQPPYLVEGTALGGTAHLIDAAAALSAATAAISQDPYRFVDRPGREAGGR